MVGTFEELRSHVGHKVEVVTYGRPVANVAAECLDCCVVLIDFDAPPHQHQWSSGSGSYGGGAWSCACGATKPRIIGPGI